MGRNYVIKAAVIMEDELRAECKRRKRVEIQRDVACKERGVGGRGGESKEKEWIYERRLFIREERRRGRE